MNPEDQSWKVFQRDTEAGRLLSRLYGYPPSQSKVTYPKQRRRRATDGDEQKKKPKEEANARGWRTTYTVRTLSKAEEEEKEIERKTNISRALSIKVPKVGRATGQRSTLIDGTTLAKVDCIPRRKTETGCRNNVEQAKFLNKKYRPPAAHAFSSDSEKQRLNDLFSGAKGKCLPTVVQRLSSKSDSTKCIFPDSMFDQIYQEIKERREHQIKLERLGAGEATRQTTVNEIQSRVNQLRRIDPKKAEVVITMLMS